MKKLKIGFFQFKPKHGKPEENLKFIESYSDKIKEADIIVLPELATTGYVFHSKEELLPLADEIPEGKQSKFFSDLAKNTDTLIITGLAEREEDRLFNSQAAFYPDGKVVRYRKLHLFYKEKQLFEPSDNEPAIIDYKGVKIGLMICFDWAFPEHARLLMLKGAQILAHSSNLVLPGLGQAGMRIRSIENRVFSITANRFGEEDGVKFTGKSQIVNPKGEILQSAGENETTIKIVEIHPEDANDKNITPLNNILEDSKITLKLLSKYVAFDGGHSSK